MLTFEDSPEIWETRSPNKTACWLLKGHACALGPDLAHKLHPDAREWSTSRARLARGIERVAWSRER